ncbi:toll/interleukin-1 receptor domain-containing protein [Mucilaginibacter aquariorum]|uniref:Toll/interleukin-1 receptor domain-containing protein n=1 Tax=Mucilaginibacter aquariorum TaxID=2967225 RepID=A0ABT1T622_9SPHI|nr:toll/interleukin-1 receptor domain-containing protein [Mucilaginibacter aquariorum]MCQ6960019.1 toll/interleukin-1 receptor domain-containing protein [Mucilaginibacter aquariorum]
MDISPKVFISYSWTTPTHEDWVINLSERLMSDGVDVTIDKWNLKEGQDKYSFMESMVTSPDISRVLIILDEKYAEKANGRNGGVGTETQIISPQIYSNVSQEKFIPIVSERDSIGEPFLPTYLEGRIYIDLSSLDFFEENYEKLLRNIFQRPAYTKPKIGTAPTYLFESKITTPRISALNKSLMHVLDKHPERVNTISKDFFNEYYQALKLFSLKDLSNNSIDIGRQVVENLNEYTDLRNDFIYFFSKIVQPELKINSDIVIKFFERLNLLKDPLDDRGSWAPREFAIFHFIIHELFLYVVALSLEAENYLLLDDLFYSQYFLQDKYERYKEPVGFEKLYNATDVFDEYYKQTFSKNFFSSMADLIVKRIPESIDKNLFIDADLLCHYVAVLNGKRWFPLTYVYKKDRKPELFRRLNSQRHFEKTKGLFGVKNVEELKIMLNDFKLKEVNRNYGYSNSFDLVTPIYNLVDIDSIGSSR